VTVEVDGIAVSSVPGSRSPTGSSQTLPSAKRSDNGDSGSESSGSSTSTDGSSSISDSDSDSDSDDNSNTSKKSVQATEKPRRVGVAGVANTQAVASPRKLGRSTAVTKRRKTDETGGFVATSIIQQPKSSNPHQKGDDKGQPRKTNTPFSRIKVDEIKFKDDRLKDNSFGSRKAAANDYGAKASADLIVTRGAGFRKEKNKKKRGSYRGGDITVRWTDLGGYCITDTIFI